MSITFLRRNFQSLSIRFRFAFAMLVVADVLGGSDVPVGRTDDFFAIDLRIGTVLAALPLALFTLLAGCGATAPTAEASKTAAWRSVGLAPASQPASPWASLQSQVGRAPAESNDFLRSGRLAERLGALLGEDNYLVLLQNMRTTTPLRQEGGLLYITGHRYEQADAEAAAVVVHPAADTVRVWLSTGSTDSPMKVMNSEYRGSTLPGMNTGFVVTP